MKQEYLILINPEPWKIGPLSIGRKAGKVFPMIGRDSKLAAYQEALKEELVALSPEKIASDKLVRLRLAFSRQIVGRAKVADLSNMVKSTEDALQGVLFDNDKATVLIEACIFEQHKEATGWVYIQYEAVSIMEATTAFESYLRIIKMITKAEEKNIASENVWPPVFEQESE